MTDDQVSVLAPRATARRLSRRSFLGGVAGIGAAGLLGGCGGGKFAPSAALDGKPEGRLNVYSWGDYDDPGNLSAFHKKTGITLQVDSYTSNEQMIGKLGATRGTSGYDIVVPTGSYIPMMSHNGLLEKLDHSRLKNIENIEPIYRNQSWDRGAKYSLCKDWGTTGFVYDTTIIKKDLTSWKDFIETAQGVGDGKTSLLEDPGEVTTIWFAANGIDPNTTKKADLDACEKGLLNELAPHIRAFTSNPSQNITQSDYALIQAWNGDARQGILNSSKKDQKKWKYVFPTPTANIWMDTWAVAAGCRHPDAAYEFIDYILQPEVSYRELDWNGYPTGINGLEDVAKKEEVEFLDLIFPAEDVLKRLTALEVNSAADRITSIYGKMLAKAASS